MPKQKDQKKKLLLVMAGALVLFISVWLVFTARPSENVSEKLTPVEVARAYHVAGGAHPPDLVVAETDHCIAERMRAGDDGYTASNTCGHEEGTYFQNPLSTTDVVFRLLEQSNDRAVVELSHQNGPLFRYTLIIEDGRWKISWIEDMRSE